MTIDYESEKKKLEAFVPGEGSMFWKPEVGQHRVTALTELEEAEPFIGDDEAPKPQAKISLRLADGNEVTWTMSKGKTMSSTYGQLVALAFKKGGLKDLPFMVVVTSDGKKRTFAIVDIA